MPTLSHRSARRRGMVLGAALSSRSSRKAAAATSSAAPQPQPSASQQPAPASDMATQLTELKSLLDQGILTQAEFDAKKQQILGL